MKNTVYNPYLPGFEYVPDGEPYVFGDRVYIFGSHDRAGGNEYCMEDYVGWSAPIDDLSEWKQEGIIYRRDQDPDNPEGTKALYAPDVEQGVDGRYYLYYTIGSVNYISVAVCDTPAGSYEYYGTIRFSDGMRMNTPIPFDPAVLRDEDERIWLYFGFCPHFKMHGMEIPDTEGAMCVELEADMITCKGEPRNIIPNKMHAAHTEYEGHAFFEAASIRKIKGLYHFIYSSQHMHELCYATSRYPDRDFAYRGTVISNGDIGYRGIAADCARNATANNHGGLAKINGRWYIFYHRHTHGTQFSRQGCAEPVEIMEDGSIPQVEMTSCGLNGRIMPARGITPAYCACNLYKGKGAKPIEYGPVNVAGPYVVENQNDIPEKERIPYITNITDNSAVTFKYLSFDGKETTLTLFLRGKAKGSMMIDTDDEGRHSYGVLTIDLDMEAWTELTTTISVRHGNYPLRFLYLGEGMLSLASYRIN